MLSGHKRTTIGELCEFINGNGFRPPDWKPAGLPIIRIQNLNGSKSFNYFDGVPKPKWIVEPGDLLFAWAGVKGVSFGPTIWPGPKGVLNQHIFRVTPHKGVDKYWLYLALQAVTQRIEANAHGFKSSLVHVHKDDITGQLVDVPPLAEQRKIAEILRTWDEAIEASERRREAKAIALTAARQRVFGLDGSPPGKWPSAKLEEIIDRVRRLADGGDHPVMTISGKSGFKRQDEKFDRFMAGDSVDRYLLLNRGEFAYNKGNSKTYPQGCIYRLEKDTALVPFVYFAFALRDNLNSDFYAHLFEAGFLNHQLSRLINSGVRNDGLLNIYADDFFSCVVPVPPEPEQARIAAYFNLAKQELASLDRQIDALSQQKRGLMQKLLTGEWRVKVDA